MKTKNSNRVNMINSTIGYSDANTAATAGIPSYATILAQVKSKMVLINSYNQVGDGTTKGVTLDTNALRKEMTMLALKCANATLAYANSIHNNTLAALVNYSESKLNRTKKEDIDDVCQAIHDATAANSAGAINFGIVASDITDLQASIDLYRTASQNPRQAIISKSQAKKQVTNMLGEVITDLLEAQMDKMVNTLKSSNRNFWDGYKQARETLELGITHAKVSGVVFNVVDDAIEGVSFKMYETGTTNLVKEVFTGNKGKFATGKIPVGNYDFVWEMDGYTTIKQTNIHVGAGKEVRRKVVLKKSTGAVREGDLNMGIFANIDLTGLNLDNVVSVIVEAKNSTMRFYGTSNPTSAAGAVFLEVSPGPAMIMSGAQFATQTGFGAGNLFLNVQNSGAMTGHWKVTFNIS